MSFDAQPVADQGLQGPGIPVGGIDQPASTAPDAGTQTIVDAPNPLLTSAFPELHHPDGLGPTDLSSAESLKTYLSSDLVDIRMEPYHLHGGLEAPLSTSAAGSTIEGAVLASAILPDKTEHVLQAIDASNDLIDAIADYAKHVPRDASGRFAELPESERLARALMKSLRELLDIQGFGKLGASLDRLIRIGGLEVAELVSDVRRAYVEVRDDPGTAGRADAQFRAILAAIEQPAGKVLGMAGGVELGIMALPVLELAGPIVTLAAIGALGMTFSKYGGVLLKEVTLNLESSMAPGDLNSLTLPAIASWLQRPFAGVR